MLYIIMHNDESTWFVLRGPGKGMRAEKKTTIFQAVIVFPYRNPGEITEPGILSPDSHAADLP
jgi:hypothetical protein